MEPKSLPKTTNKSIKIDPRSTPAPKRLPDDLPGLILEVPGCIFDLKTVISDASRAYFTGLSVPAVRFRVFLNTFWKPS